MVLVSVPARVQNSHWKGENLNTGENWFMWKVRNLTAGTWCAGHTVWEQAQYLDKHFHKVAGGEVKGVATPRKASQELWELCFSLPSMKFPGEVGWDGLCGLPSQLKMLTGSISSGSTGPGSKERNLLVDEKQAAELKAARESLSLLPCCSEGAGVVLRQPCCAVWWALAIGGNRAGNLRRQLGCGPRSFGLDAVGAANLMLLGDISWRSNLCFVLFNLSQTSELLPFWIFSSSRLFRLISYLYVFLS